MALPSRALVRTLRPPSSLAPAEGDALLHVAFEQAAIGMALVGLDGRALRVNAAMATMLRRDAAELVGLPARAVVHADDLPLLRVFFEALVAGRRERVVAEARFVRSDGQVRWGAVTIALAHDASGVARYAVAMAEDVTARRVAEEALAARHRELAALQRIANIGIAAESIDDAFGRLVREVSAVTEMPIVVVRLHDPARDRLELRAMIGLPPGVASLPVDETFGGVVQRTGEPLVERDLQRRGDASAAGLRARGVRTVALLPLRGRRRVLGVLALAHVEVVAVDDAWLALATRLADQVAAITERMLAEEALVAARDEAERANRAKSDFLSRMSHELRTPLNSVIGFANVLRRNRDGHLAAAELEYVERVRANGAHLLSLVNDILDLSKIEAGRMVLEPGPVALDALVRETVAALAERAAEQGVALRAAVPEGLRPVTADALRLKQVLLNLVGNALKFTRAGSVTVSVACEREGRRPLRVDVTDTGCGIPASRLEAIFGAFEQADASTAREYGGTGLGLPISRALCRLMGFELEAASAVGVGSTFSVLLGR